MRPLCLIALVALAPACLPELAQHEDTAFMETDTDAETLAMKIS